MRSNRRIAVATVASVNLAFAFYAAVLAPRRIESVRLRLAVPDLPSPLCGLRIAHLSDFHAGGRGVSERLLTCARDVALGFRPDIVAMTGDYIDGPADDAALTRLADWPDWTQVVAVLGNHDYEHHNTLSELIERFHRNGVHLLRNAARPLCLRGQTVWVAGVEDPFSLRADPARAFAHLPPCEPALLYLAHSPSNLANLPAQRFRVMLSGHTHGGQIRVFPSGRVPFVSLLRKLTGEREPYAAPERHRGVHRLGPAALIISNGIGTSQIPIRIRSRPQVILIELARTTGESTGVAIERLG